MEEIPILGMVVGKGQIQMEQKDQGSKRIKDTDKSERRGKLPGICKFLSMLYTKLQPYCQTIK